jgi:hypothetical protein
MQGIILTNGAFLFVRIYRSSIQTFRSRFLTKIAVPKPKHCRYLGCVIFNSNSYVRANEKDFGTGEF